MPLVDVMNVTKEYANGEETIRPLDGVSLSIDEGDFVSLMGASGSGKSTLLNLVAGIDLVTSGEIVVADTDITKLSRGKLADWRARHIGYIFQTHNLIPVLTAYENVELPLLLLPMSAAERRKRVEIAMEAVDLTSRAAHYPRQMSGGQEQRVGIAAPTRSCDITVAAALSTTTVHGIRRRANSQAVRRLPCSSGLASQA
ncbi:MAG: ABC transporter ATP-binding protein [Gemmatimonadales bacterium]